MKVSDNNTVPQIPAKPKVAKSTESNEAPETALASEDSVDLRRVNAMLSQLENKPEVRPEVLARGRALAAQADYPPPQIIDKLASLIVGESAAS
jgi:hypothetical protein